MAAVLFFYAANSEVAWLFLLSYWVVAVVVASFFYALWNRGVEPEIDYHGFYRTEAVAPDEAADLGLGPFETDRIRIDFVFRVRGRPRGPYRTRIEIGGTPVDVAVGRVTREGVTVAKELPAQRRGPVAMHGWTFESSDPLGLFVYRGASEDDELLLMLPRFTSLHSRPVVRELEASVAAPRAGMGNELFGVREYRPGDSLRRIHWRSTARRGELVVREFEPPGVQSLGIFLDGRPESVEVADQLARIAASEAWDCLRAGGRVTLWAPGCEPTPPDEQRNLQALLEWLARYPQPTGQNVPPPRAADAIAVTAGADAMVLDALEDVRAHGGSVRAWVVGDGSLRSDVPFERASLEWPL